MPSSAPAGRLTAWTCCRPRAPYPLIDLLGDPALVETYRDSSYGGAAPVERRHHRFHAPADLRVEHVTYISGDTWNVNPVALKRVEKLYCRMNGQ